MDEKHPDEQPGRSPTPDATPPAARQGTPDAPAPPPAPSTEGPARAALRVLFPHIAPSTVALVLGVPLDDGQATPEPEDPGTQQGDSEADE